MRIITDSKAKAEPLRSRIDQLLATAGEQLDKLEEQAEQLQAFAHDLAS